MRDPKAYAKKVEAYVDKYASNEDADNAGDNGDDEPMSKSAGNGKTKTHASHPNGTGSGSADDDDDDDDSDDNMSDMGELSDGDEFMGEMDD